MENPETTALPEPADDALTAVQDEMAETFNEILPPDLANVPEAEMSGIAETLFKTMLDEYGRCIRNPSKTTLDPVTGVRTSNRERMAVLRQALEFVGAPGFAKPEAEKVIEITWDKPQAAKVKTVNKSPSKKFSWKG